MPKLIMYFFTIIILCGLALPIFSRPMQVLEDYDKEAKEDSYGDNYKSDSDDYLHNAQNSLKQDDSDPVGQEKDYLENSNNDQEESSHPSHNGLLSTNSDIKRTAECNKSHMLFRSFEKPHNSKHNANEVKEPSDLYFRKPNTVHNIVRDADNLGVEMFENKRAGVDRDRRQIKKSELNESVGADEISKQKYEFNAYEDEETAIKRHIKKLSKEELDELLHSLSDDKRTLLKNIIDNSQQDNEAINKREITKKAGANEENSFVGNEQSDASKMQGGSDIESESALPNTEKLDSKEKSDSETICSKSTENVNTSEKSTDKVNILDNIQDVKLETEIKNNLDSSLTQVTMQTGADAEQESSKKENKREISSKSGSEATHEISKSDTFNTEDLYCSENDDLSRLWNEESKLYDSNNINKRDTAYNIKSIRSLEESFPNSEDKTNLKSETNMLPLIRVKRTNFDKVLEKRDVNELSNLKVPFHSNSADGDVEDSEADNEGSEFEEKGFFDKRTNFAAVGELKTQDSYAPIVEDDNIRSCSRTKQLERSDNIESDIVGLGSDSDAVLSGIEGVDDNIMYSSVSRNKRSPAEVSKLNNEENLGNLMQKNAPKLLSINEEDNDISEQNNNAQRYQENDAFGSLPRNYEEELGRFKRIRRLKPLPNQDNNI